MCDDNQHIQSDIKNTKLLVHFKLFCIVVKNLIDNAFKYGQTKQVIITQKDNAILFINDGKPLKKELSYYLTPFNEQKNANSFGLGLYIIQNILNAHDFNLEYEYKEEKNIFKIIL
jgi:two-component system OmpR family sensor kinase